jgi:hypothetical protein
MVASQYKSLSFVCKLLSEHAPMHFAYAYIIHVTRSKSLRTFLDRSIGEVIKIPILLSMNLIQCESKSKIAISVKSERQSI